MSNNSNNNNNNNNKQQETLDKWQKTLSVLISKRCDPECIDFFLPHVKDVNFGTDQANPLLSAVWSDEVTNPDLVKYLVGKGANPNTKSSQGSTPIHFLAQQGNLELVKWLGENGADLFAVTNNGSDISFFARQCQQQVPEMAKFARELTRPSKEVMDENVLLKKKNDELLAELNKYKDAVMGQDALKRVLCDNKSSDKSCECK